MIDLLLKWTDRDTAIACGQALGCTALAADDPDEPTACKFGIMNIAVLRYHKYLTDLSDPDNPVYTDVPGWWVLLRLEAGDPDAILAALPQAVQPAVVWRSDDESPYPDVTVAPQIGWL